MDANAASDMENVKASQHNEEDDIKASHKATKQRTASFLAGLSLVLLAESVYRIVSVAATPEGGWGASDDLFPPVVLLLGGIFELLFSTLGLFVGLGWSVFDLEHKMLTVVLLGTQAVLGLFTYAVFTIAMPAFYIDRSPGNDTSTAASVFGWILTAVGYAGVLQGGQFLVALQLFHLQGSNSRLGSSYFTPRLMLFGALVFLVGASTFICGVITRHLGEDDMAKTTSDNSYPGVYLNALTAGPLFGVFNAIRYPAITIISGILTFFFGLAAMLTAATTTSLLKPLLGMGAMVWLWLISAHVLVQYGTMAVSSSVGPGAPSLLGVEAVFTGLMVTVLVMVPLYYAKEAHRVKE